MSIKEQYIQATQALKNLEIGDYPDFETVKSKLSKHQKEAINKGKGQLVICPAITKEFTFYDLVNRFDDKQSKKTYVYHELWDQYDLTGPASIIVVNNELKGTNKTPEQQRKIKDTFINPAEYLMLQSINRPNYLNKITITRFPQLETKTVDVFSYVPSANSYDSGLVILRESDGIAYPRGGVRLSVGQRITLEPSNLSSFSQLLEDRERITHDLIENMNTWVEEFNRVADNMIDSLEDLSVKEEK